MQVLALLGVRTATRTVHKILAVPTAGVHGEARSRSPAEVSRCIFVQSQHDVDALIPDDVSRLLESVKLCFNPFDSCSHVGLLLNVHVLIPMLWGQTSPRLCYLWSPWDCSRFDGAWYRALFIGGYLCVDVPPELVLTYL